MSLRVQMITIAYTDESEMTFRIIPAARIAWERESQRRITSGELGEEDVLRLAWHAGKLASMIVSEFDAWVQTVVAYQASHEELVRPTLSDHSLVSASS